MRLAGLALAVVAVMTALTACNDAPPGVGAVNREVRGLVVDVQARSLLDLDYIDLRDQEGQTKRLDAPPSFRGFTPSHLREHMVQGDPVTVTYRQDGDRLIIVDITD